MVDALEFLPQSHRGSSFWARGKHLSNLRITPNRDAIHSGMRVD